MANYHPNIPCDLTHRAQRRHHLWTVATMAHDMFPDDERLAAMVARARLMLLEASLSVLTLLSREVHNHD